MEKPPDGQEQPPVLDHRGDIPLNFPATHSRFPSNPSDLFLRAIAGSRRYTPPADAEARGRALLALLKPGPLQS